MQHLQADMLTEAREHFIEGDYQVAEPLLTQMILQNSRDPEVYQMLATIFYDKGQFNKAIKTFKRALEIDPTYTDASVGLSIILNDLGRYDEGKKIFEEARGILDRKSGKMDSYVEEKIASKHEELADLYFQYKKYSEALDQLLRAQKLSTRKAEISLRIAECHVKLGDEARAIKDLKALVREYPHLTAARMKLGILFYNGSQLAEAVEQWESVLMRDPDHPEATKYLRMANAVGLTSLSL
jgi:tetratricopeptide (TPR) repeat protein